MYCSNCNREIPDNAEYCPHCGKKNNNHTGSWNGMNNNSFNGVALGDNSLGNNALGNKELFSYSSSKQKTSMGAIFLGILIAITGIALGLYAFIEYSGMSLTDIIEYFSSNLTHINCYRFVNNTMAGWQ